MAAQPIYRARRFPDRGQWLEARRKRFI